jgi:hypothetical protein
MNGRKVHGFFAKDGLIFTAERAVRYQLTN